MSSPSVGPEARPPQPCMWPQQDGHPSTDGLRPRVPCSASLGTTPRKVSVRPAGMTTHSSISTQNIPSWRQASGTAGGRAHRPHSVPGLTALTAGTEAGCRELLGRVCAAPERDMHFTPPLTNALQRTKLGLSAPCGAPLPCPRMSGQCKSLGPGSLSAEPR